MADSRITVNVIGLDKTKDLFEDAMQWAFLAGFTTADHLWQDSVGAELGGNDTYSQEEMVARYKNWRETVGKTKEEISEMTLQKLREKLLGVSQD